MTAELDLIIPVYNEGGDHSRDLRALSREVRKRQRV